MSDNLNGGCYESAGIKVTMITAGHVKTNITLHALTGNGSYYGKMQESVAGGISPGLCVDGIITAVAAGKYDALVGGIEKYNVLLKRLFPGLLRMALAKHPMKKPRTAGLLPKIAYAMPIAVN
jgi:dehydrogenase/reductase SDR family member 7B